MRTSIPAIVALGFALTVTACRSEAPVERPVKESISCGGLAGFGCPAGLTCVDQPDDDCDPNQDGADCIGVCAKTCDPQHEPTRTYVATAQMCPSIRFICALRTHYFTNECGCGCEAD